MNAPRIMVPAVLALCLLAAAPAWSQVTVELRGGAPDRVVTAAVELDRGLEVRVVQSGKPEVREVLPWDEVRGVIDASGRASASEFMAVAEDLWRARIRVARNDAALARPLLARHWDRLRGEDGPTAQLVAEGLLRAALEEGDLVAAAGPWIESLRLGMDGTPTRFPALPPMLDDSTGLLPGLAPFAPSEIRDALVQALGSAAASTRRSGAAAGSASDVAATVAAQMARLLEPSSGASAAAGASADDAPAIRALGAVEAIVAAADARARERAVAEFDKRYPEPPAFLAAWRLAAIGAGSAREARAAAPGDRASALLRAALDNLAVPASGLDETGLVDAYAIEVAEQLTREAGDTAAAAALASVKAERLRDAAVRLGPAPAPAGGAASGGGARGTTRS